VTRPLLHRTQVARPTLTCATSGQLAQDLAAASWLRQDERSDFDADGINMAATQALLRPVAVRVREV
jgi:hypothetical protein